MEAPVEMQILNCRRETRGEYEIKMFDIYLPKEDYTFRNWKYVEGKKGPFVSPPSFCVEGEDFEGNPEKRWFPYVEIGPLNKKAFFETALRMAREQF